MDAGSYIYVYISSSVDSSVVKRLFDVDTYAEIDDEVGSFQFFFCILSFLVIRRTEEESWKD